MSFYTYMISIVIRRQAAIAVSLVSTMMVFAADSLFFPCYKSEATILISVDQYLSQLENGAVTDQTAERFLDAQRMALISDHVLTAALVRLYPDKNHDDISTASLRSDISIIRVPFTNTFELQLKRRGARDAHIFLDAVIDSYTAWYKSKNYDNAIQLKNILASEVSGLEAQLADAEKTLAAFDEQNESVLIDELYLDTKRKSDRIALILAQEKPNFVQLSAEDVPLVNNFAAIIGDENYGLFEKRLIKPDDQLPSVIQLWTIDQLERLDKTSNKVELEKQKSILASEMRRLTQLKAQRQVLQNRIAVASGEWRTASARLRKIDGLLVDNNKVYVERIISPVRPVIVNPIGLNLAYGLLSGVCLSFLTVYIVALHGFWGAQKKHL